MNCRVVDIVCSAAELSLTVIWPATVFLDELTLLKLLI
jgi:hypothetical protein